MNKKYLNLTFLFFSLIITLLSCNKNDENIKCLSFAKALVTKVEGADSALVNQEIILTVSFGCYNGCGQFENLDEVNSGDTTTITVNEKYEGCYCTQDAPIRQYSYKFKKSQTGSFYLRFLQTENVYLTHTIIVH